MVKEAATNPGLCAGLKDFFDNVGKAFKKPAAALLLSQLSVEEAARVSGLPKDYVYSTRKTAYSDQV